MEPARRENASYFDWPKPLLLCLPSFSYLLQMFLNRLIFFLKSKITPSFVLLFWLISFTLRLTWICVTGKLAQQRHLQYSHRLSSREHRKTKQIETFRFCITIFISKSTSWARDPIIMLATTPNSSGIPDKAWQPNFVVIETTWVFEFMPVLRAHSSPITWN